MAVREFSELLKLSINQNKHIMCYRDETRAEFVVILDVFACVYVIDYKSENPEKKEERMSAL